jgi:3,4-dihydroxy 2-butanone 4-phosphate synthase/GTP cyclohydrolase II
VQAPWRQNAKPGRHRQPGHIFPLMAQKGGVLIRAGHTEAGCDLAQLAGLEPASVICEILKDDGTMARLPDLLEFAQEHGLKIGAIRDLIEYRAATEHLVEKVSEKDVDTAHGRFRLSAFEDKTSGDVHFALSHGDIAPSARPWCGCTSRSRWSTSSTRQRPPQLPGQRRRSRPWPRPRPA